MTSGSRSKKRTLNARWGLHKRRSAALDALMKSSQPSGCCGIHLHHPPCIPSFYASPLQDSYLKQSRFQTPWQRGKEKDGVQGLRRRRNRSNLSVVRISPRSVTQQSAFSLPLIEGFVPIRAKVGTLMVNGKGKIGDVDSLGEVLLFVKCLYLKESPDGIGA